jgi:hypothetical protein
VNDCACGLIGDGKSVLDIEHYIRTFIGRKGVSKVEIAWYWGAKASSSTKMENLAFDTFCRLNEAKSLDPDTWYDMPLPARAQPHAEDEEAPPEPFSPACYLKEFTNE